MKKVVITGGNKGIGLATTIKFLENDWLVIIIARDFSTFNLHSDNIQKEIFDLTKTELIPNLVKKIGEIDVLINCAGVMNSSPYDNYPSHKKDYLMKLNLDAPVDLINESSKTMLAHKKGRIINIASIAGEIGHPDIWYGISKAGIINMTKSFAKILGPSGIIINAVAPGPVQTDLLNTIPEERKHQLKNATYLNRFAQPKEIAEVIYWLATTSPDYLNGCCIDVNNGSFPR